MYSKNAKLFRRKNKNPVLSLFSTRPNRLERSGGGEKVIKILKMSLFRLSSLYVITTLEIDKEIQGEKNKGCF